MTDESSIRIYANRWFAKFAAKEKIGNAALVDAVRRAERGLIDADLGSGLIKQRIARRGGGKSGGYRSILVFRSGDRAMFCVCLCEKCQGEFECGRVEGLSQGCGYHARAKRRPD